jgi:hypothetical protein
MKKCISIGCSTAVLLMAGCQTTEVKPVSWQEQQAYMAKVRDPRIYGLSIYQTPGGIEYRGGGRLHPNQIEALPMQLEEPLRPAVMMKGNFGLESPILLDFSSTKSCLEFDLAQKLGSQPIGERDAQLVKMPGEDEVAGCLSMVPSIRFRQLYIERPLVYVRMANGFIGPLARGIEKPELKGMIGWEIMRKFGQIQLNYPEKMIVLVTDEKPYTPNPAQLVAGIPLVKYAGVCAVRGAVDGKAGLVLIDPAGDFEVATDGAAAVSAIQLDAGLIFSAPAVTNSPGGTRIGARLLQNYRITICPAADMIYFEKPDAVKGK